MSCFARHARFRGWGVLFSDLVRNFLIFWEGEDMTWDMTPFMSGVLSSLLFLCMRGVLAVWEWGVYMVASLRNLYILYLTFCMEMFIKINDGITYFCSVMLMMTTFSSNTARGTMRKYHHIRQ